MIPLYFGDTEKPLFGVHHQPKSTQYQDASVVLCNPIGFEYSRAHGVLRYLATQLSLNGYHVLRFDYYATGDSSGKSQDISIDQCMADIVSACDEIQAMSATQKVNVIAYRFGALLSAFVSRDYKFNKFLMWDPVINGKEYLNDMQDLHNAMLIDDNRFDLRFKSDVPNPVELIGHSFSANFRNQIGAMDLADLKKLKTCDIDVFTYADSYPVKSVINDTAFLAQAKLHRFENAIEWKVVDKIESKISLDPSLAKIIEVVG